MYVRIASRTTTKLCRAQQLLAIAHQESLHQVHVAGGETGVTIGQIVMPHAQEACIEAQTADLGLGGVHPALRSEEHTSELQSPVHLVCRLLLEKKNINRDDTESAAGSQHWAT